MKIRVSLRCMAASEIADMIPPETISEIKKTDPTPMFRAYVVGHEGEARGNLIGFGNIVKRWYRAVVEKLHAKIETGLQAFHGHGVTNSQEGRLPIGHVVGKKLMEIKGRMSSVVACYIEPAHRRHNLDVASIEANVDLDVDKLGNIIATDVNEVSAIALASSQVETPGFEGATLLGQLQAFAKEQGLNLKSEERLRRTFRIHDTTKPEKLRLV